jgi:hypothetical protein
VVALSMTERRAVTKQMALRYEAATKPEKGRMLDELCALTNWTRRHARRALTEAARPPRVTTQRRGRPVVYGQDVLAPLQMIWATLNGPTGKRLAPFMGEIVEALERSRELQVDPAVRTKLLSISAATIDRALAPERARLQVKGRSGTKPGSILKSQIPIRTFAQWDERRPGFCEMDLVAHDGGNPAGEFCQTLTLTCVNTGWTEVRALRNKAQRWCFEALKDIRTTLPFPLLGIDSDNGSEFINNQLFTYCEDESITFTRSRPEHKNDNCYVEGKNWTVVRQQVGYARYDTVEALEILRELYVHLRLYVNFFQPQTHLIEKIRRGAKVSRRYDRARTPYQRVLDAPGMDRRVKDELTRTFLALNPAQLKRDLGTCQDRLMALAPSYPDPRKEVNRFPPIHFGRALSRTSFMRQRMASSRTS